MRGYISKAMSNNAQMTTVELQDLVAQLGLPDVSVRSRRFTPLGFTQFEYRWRCGCRAVGEADESVNVNTCPNHRAITRSDPA
jgi:hypothetical protein